LSVNISKIFKKTFIFLHFIFKFIFFYLNHSLLSLLKSVHVLKLFFIFEVIIILRFPLKFFKPEFNLTIFLFFYHPFFSLFHHLIIYLLISFHIEFFLFCLIFLALLVHQNFSFIIIVIHYIRKLFTYITMFHPCLSSFDILFIRLILFKNYLLIKLISYFLFLFILSQNL